MSDSQEVMHLLDQLKPHATESELRLLYDYDPDDIVPDRIETVSGEWRRDGDVWRFHQDAEQ